MLDLIEEAYLAAPDPRRQSGFSGDEAKWERDRGPIAMAMERDGSFLDVGCASGHLMETVTRWCADGGITIEPHGLELSPRLAELARARLPHWAHRIHTGDVMTWQPPQRYDYVRIDVYMVAAERHHELLERAALDLATPGGRVIFCSYGSSRRAHVVADPVIPIVEDAGYVVSGSGTVVAENGRITTRTVWFDV